MRHFTKSLTLTDAAMPGVGFRLQRADELVAIERADRSVGADRESAERLEVKGFIPFDGALTGVLARASNLARVPRSSEPNRSRPTTSLSQSGDYPMIRRILAMGTAIITSVAITACSDTTGPKDLVSGGLPAAFSLRSGTLHVEKECSTYTGQAGDICTITSSTLAEIETGSRVIYATGASAQGILDTDVILDLPGPGNNAAFGHCTVDLNKIDGTTGCVFSGGTGKFTWFHANVVLSVVGGAVLAWDGTYSFSPDN